MNKNIPETCTALKCILILKSRNQTTNKLQINARRKRLAQSDARSSRRANHGQVFREWCDWTFDWEASKKYIYTCKQRRRSWRILLNKAKGRCTFRENYFRSNLETLYQSVFQLELCTKPRKLKTNKNKNQCEERREHGSRAKEGYILYEWSKKKLLKTKTMWSFL